MTDIRVACEPRSADGWTCLVTLVENADDVGRYEVGVSLADLAAFAPGADDPSDLVRASFAFLLEREPPGSILRRFDLSAIGTYFPEFASEIGGYLGRT